MTFTESNTVEQMTLDAVTGSTSLTEDLPSGLGEILRRGLTTVTMDLCARNHPPSPERRRHGGVLGERGPY